MTEEEDHESIFCGRIMSKTKRVKTNTIAMDRIIVDMNASVTSLLHPSFFDPNQKQAFQQAFEAGKPFKHLHVDNFMNVLRAITFVSICSQISFNL